MKDGVRWLVLGLVLLVVGAFTLGPGLRAEGSTKTLSPTVVSKAVRFGVTPRMRDLPPAEGKALLGLDVVKGEGGPLREIRNPVLPKASSQEGLTLTAAASDGALQSEAPVPAAPLPTLSFEGLNNDDNFNAFGFRVLPPDTNGDVGPNHYVQTVNLLFRVFDKTGTPLTAPIKMSSLFADIGGPCAANDDGDPIVLYDHLADRWLLSQFAVTSPRSHQCIAISQTGDPTGAYFGYDFEMPNTKFNDYPKFGVWPDAYYMTDNQFDPFFVGGGAFAYDRDKMLVGDATASFIYFDLELLDPTIGGMLPSDLDGSPPPAGTPNYFVYFIADEFGDPSDGLRLFEFDADFATPANSTFTERADSPLAVAAFNPLTPPGRDDIEQPPPSVVSSESLDSIGDRLMHRLVYRNFGDHESLVTNHTVNVGTGTTIATHQSAVRYYELRRPLPGGVFSVPEQATFAPDTDNRWMGSAANDNQGNLAVGYSISSLTTFPGIRYAGRLATDPPNGLFQGEATLQDGGFVQRSTSSRWGDYSSLNVDPVDECTFWYTQEYYAADNPATTAEWQTRVGTFKFAGCTAPPRGTLSGAVTICGTNTPVPGALVKANEYSRSTDGSGAYSMSLSPGSYTVSVVPPPGALPPASQVVAVSDGGTTTANFCLQGVPIVVADAVKLIKDTCQPPNNAIDPGERVTVDLTLRNTGFGATASLKGTLLPSANVGSPSGPKLYGVIQPGGTATQRYTFTASGACGQTIPLTLLLQNAGANIGTVDFTVQLGEVGAPSTDSNGEAINIPDSGAATPYPSEIAVSGLVGAVEKVTVTLSGFTHTFPSDVDVLLVAPSGQTVVLMSDAGGGTDVSSIDLTFDDDAATALPSVLVSGTFRPTNAGVGDAYPAPAPPTPHGATLAALKGASPNGTWRLFVNDDAAGDLGTFGGGWGLSIQTRFCTSACQTSKPTINVAATLTRISATAVRADLTIGNTGSGIANNVVLTQAALAGGSGVPLPQTIGNINPGASVNASVVFDPAPAAGTRTRLQVGGTHTGGTFSQSIRVIVP